MEEDSPIWRVVPPEFGCFRAAFSLTEVLPRLWLRLRHEQEASTPGEVVLVSLSVSGLSETLELDLEYLKSTLLPFLALLAAQRASLAPKFQRLLVGLAAPAGGGKTTLSQLVVVVGTVWHAVMLEISQEYRALVGPGTPPSPFATLSMDAYHIANNELLKRDLRRFKGRIDTIDAVTFANDLELLRRQGSSTVSVPEYDRAVTHDPVPGNLAIHPWNSIVVVEGLYLCASATGSATSLHPLDAVALDAWSRVRGALQLACMLAVPLRLCRDRTVARKVAAGVSVADAEAHYDRVDMPVWKALELDAAAPLPPPHRHVDLEPHAVENGPNLIFDYNGTTLFNVRQRRHVHDAEPPQRSPPRLLPCNTLVLGLNPCVQRTLVFGNNSASGSNSGSSGTAIHSTTAATNVLPAWHRGRVNRASKQLEGIGGKGQFCALAIAREARFQLTQSESSDPVVSVTLLQVLGGVMGRVIFLRHFQGALARAIENSTSVSVLQDTVALDDSQPTRTCTTVIDAHTGEMTEFVEPSHRVTHQQSDRLLERIDTWLLEHSTSSVPLCVALMGTVPPGAEALYADISTRIAAANGDGRRVLVLLDGWKGVIPALKAGGIHILKINCDELDDLFNEMIGTAAGAAAAMDNHALRSTVTAWKAIRVLEFCREQAHGRGLEAIALTDGARGATLVERVSAAQPSSGSPSFHVCFYSIPAIPGGELANPIGAGDTVAGTLITHHVAGGAPLSRAFVSALAAGSASCKSLAGADWAASDAAVYSASVRCQLETWFPLRGGVGCGC